MSALPPAAAPGNVTGFSNPDPRAYAGLLLTSFIAGSVFFFTVLTLEGYRPEELVTGKLLIGAVTLFLPIWLRGGLIKLSRRRLGWLLLLGFVGYAAPQYTLTWAQQKVDSTIAALFISTLPLFTLLLVRVLLKERYRPRKWAGFAIGLVGLVIMIDPRGALGAGGAGLTPYLALAATCLCFALSGIIVQRMPRMPALQVASLSLLFGGLFLAPFGLPGFLDSTFAHIRQSATDPAALKPVIGVLMLGTFLSGLGQALRTALIQTYGTAFFSIVGYLVPIWAALLGFIFLGEAVTLQKLVAFCVISTGLLLAQSGGRR